VETAAFSFSQIDECWNLHLLKMGIQNQYFSGDNTQSLSLLMPVKEVVTPQLQRIHETIMLLKYRPIPIENNNWPPGNSGTAGRFYGMG
jgi:hypothetical protein